MQIEGLNYDQFTREVNPISSLPNSTPENDLQNELKLLESETLAKRVANKFGSPAQDEPRGIARELAAKLGIQFSFLQPPQTTPEERRVQGVQKALSVRTSLQSQVIELFYDA